MDISLSVVKAQKRSVFQTIKQCALRTLTLRQASPMPLRINLAAFFVNHGHPALSFLMTFAIRRTKSSPGTFPETAKQDNSSQAVFYTHVARTDMTGSRCMLSWTRTEAMSRPCFPDRIRPHLSPRGRGSREETWSPTCSQISVPLTPVFIRPVRESRTKKEVTPWCQQRQPAPQLPVPCSISGDWSRTAAANGQTASVTLTRRWPIGDKCFCRMRTSEPELV